MLKKLIFTLLILIVALALVPVSNPSHAVENPDYWPTADWRTSTPEAQGMDSAELAGLVNYLADPSFYMDSLIVIRHGYIVAEAYFPPVAMEDQHQLHSTTKSFAGALVGIAIDKGFISGVDANVLEIFGDHTFESVDDRKSSMTVADFLKMSSGLTCDMYAPGGDGAIFETDDWVQAALSLPMQYTPGTEFHYCNPGSTVLSGLINQTTGMSALDFANEYLFGPLGIENAFWVADSKGVNAGHNGLQVTPRDMAKLGFLYLHNGAWDGEQIISADYVYNSTHTQMVDAFPGFDYGYQWWVLPSLNIAFAIGYSGQYIWVVPDKDLIFVQTAGETDATRIAHQLVPVLGMIAQLTTSYTALPEDTTKQADLAAAIAAIESPVALEPPAMPEIATTISGQTYNLLSPHLFGETDWYARKVGQADNWLDVVAVKITFDGSAEAVLTLTYLDGTTADIPIGLDGLFRRVESRFTDIAAVGAWLNDTTFRVNIKLIEDSVEYRLDFQFDQELLEIINFKIDDGVANATLGLLAPPAE